MPAPPDRAKRGPLTVALMLATMMISIDTTIANVALPHMQGSVSASQDQITWVLTSYIVATAIATPLTGWLSYRIGRKSLFLVSIAGFTVASMLCGVATSLFEIVLFRLLQGVFGAAVMPLSQAVVLDTYRQEELGRVMSLWGMGAMLGPISGPLVGGWLTDNFSWRWVFFINLPIGLLALVAIWAFMSNDSRPRGRAFDFVGYAALVLFIGGLQLMLDRGPTQDWFSSPEIVAEAIVAGLGLYLFIVQMLTADQPFFDPSLARDWNFVSCNLFAFLIASVLFSTMSLQPPLMQNLMGYSVMGAGLIMMPRGVGTFVAMFVVGRVLGRLDIRVIIITGLMALAIAFFQMSHFDLSMSEGPFFTSGLFQGFGVGFVFVPLSVVAFANVAPAVRADGTTIFTLVRSIGSSIGIALMQAVHTRQAAVSHADLAAEVQPSNPVMTAGLPAWMSPGSPLGLQALNREITRQAEMVAYVDVFRLMLILTIAVMPMLFLMRRPANGPRPMRGGALR